MATKPSTKTDAKAKNADSATPKPEAAKADATKSETSAASNDADSGGKGGAKKASASSRPISYFSSVSTDDYRSGWDDIFNSGKQNSTRKRVKSTAKRNGKLPASITLDADDLDPATRGQLEAAFRQHAKKKRLNYDKLSSNGQVSWQLSCRISGP
jgi:hypothetical protein|tara:strand:+ start:730 stop:1197 length:468 start_codon:yes stop_codon:yes gene_type:complete